MSLYCKKGSIIRKILFIFLLGYTFMLIPLAQLQMLFFNRVIVSDSEYKIIIILCMMLYVICIRNIKIYRFDILFWMYSILIAYVICDTLIVSIGNSFSISYAINVIGRAYAPFIIGYFFCTIKLKINMNKIFKTIIGFSLINLIFSYIQKYNNSILFKYQYDQHGNQIFNSINFGENNFRSVGITSSGYNLGIILIFLLIISLVMVLFGKNNFLKIKRSIFIILIPFCILGIIFTQTRNIYFFTIYTVIYIIFYKIFKGVRVVFKYCYPIIMPIVYWMVVSTIAYSPGIISNVVGSANTFFIRMNIFNENIYNIKKSGIWTKLFGAKIIEIDNIFLYWTNNIGIIGMVIILTFIVILYIKLVNIKQLDTITLILACYLSGIFFVGLFNLLPFEYYFFSIILVTIWIRERRKYI